MANADSDSKKSARQNKLLVCFRTITTAIKVLQEEYRILLPGLLTELRIHDRILFRIQHQFKSSKFLRHCKAIQACHRRIRDSENFQFNSTFSKHLQLQDSIHNTLIKLSQLGILFKQLTQYAQAVAAIVTDTLTQEYYYFLGSDVAVLAVVSRTWVIAKQLFQVLNECWNRISTATNESKLKSLRNVVVDPHEVFLKISSKSDEFTEKNLSPEVATIKGKKRKSTEKVKGSKKRKDGKTGGALDRFL